MEQIASGTFDTHELAESAVREVSVPLKQTSIIAQSFVGQASG